MVAMQLHAVTLTVPGWQVLLELLAMLSGLTFPHICLTPVPYQAQEVEAAVVGQLPAWLRGSLLVNGGGDYSRMQHMFDGYAAVTKVKVADGKAWGRQRYLNTQAYSSYKQRGEQ